MKQSLLCLLMLLFTQPLMAYELSGTSWDMDDHPDGVVWCPRLDTAANIDETTRAAFSQALDDAMARWTNSALPCSAFVATRSESCSGEPSIDSQQNFVYWESNWDAVPAGTSTFALTLTWSTAGVQSASTVLFNQQNHTWRTDGSEVDLGSIATHEFGHFAGLAHHDLLTPDSQSACSQATESSYPSVMCTDHPGGTLQTLTQDDIDGICSLYEVDGEQGSPCTNDTSCVSGVCHPDGFCTEACNTTADCPSNYECLAGLCERVLPEGVITDCGGCGWLECLSRSFCLEADDVPFCSRPCIEDEDCPLGFGCYPLQGLGSGCYPFSNTCSQDEPSTGEFCDLGDICALGNICIDENNTKTCRWICRTGEDCPGNEACVQRGDVSVCDGSSGQTPDPTDPSDPSAPTEPCECDLLFGCEEGCACDPDCQTNPDGECECDRTAGCDPLCACDQDCSGCTCQSAKSLGALWLLLLSLGIRKLRRYHPAAH